MEIEALNDFVFLKIIKQEDTKGGIIVSDISRAKPSLAEVVVVGPGKVDKNGNFIKTNLKPGDAVIVDPFSLQPIKIEGEEYWFLHEYEILAKKIWKNKSKNKSGK